MIITASQISKGDVITTAGKTLQVSGISPITRDDRLYVEGMVQGDRATHIVWLYANDSVIKSDALA